MDRTIALAHCYDSDKAQPGRIWYARSLAFHDWVSQALSVSPTELGMHIDWLFREAVKDLANEALEARSVVYLEQRAPYKGRGFPEPGEDPELIGMIREVLGNWLIGEPTVDDYRQLTRQIYAYVTQENKRKNLVGEGFEDVIAAVVRRLPFRQDQNTNRVVLHDVSGFHRPPANEKAKKVDLALVANEKTNARQCEVEYPSRPGRTVSERF